MSSRFEYEPWRLNRQSSCRVIRCIGREAKMPSMSRISFSFCRSGKVGVRLVSLFLVPLFFSFPARITGSNGRRVAGAGIPLADGQTCGVMWHALATSHRTLTVHKASLRLRTPPALCFRGWYAIIHTAYKSHAFYACPSRSLFFSFINVYVWRVLFMSHGCLDSSAAHLPCSIVLARYAYPRSAVQYRGWQQQLWPLFHLQQVELLAIHFWLWHQQISPLLVSEHLLPF